MALISSNANISAIKMDELADAPSTPGSADWKLYFKADGLYYIDDAAAETGPLGAGLTTDPAWAAAGDLVYGTADNAAAILSIGSAHQVLTVNAGATAPAWSTGGRVLIGTQTPTGGTATFAAIPGTYNSLYLEWVARSDRASNTTEALLMYFNGDTTGGNYYRERLSGYDTTTAASEADNTDAIQVTGATAPANSAGAGWARIMNYAGTTFYKVVNYVFGYRTVSGGSNTHNVWVASVEWENTAAITQIDLVTANGSNFVSGSTFRLYGET